MWMGMGLWWWCVEVCVSGESGCLCGLAVAVRGVCGRVVLGTGTVGGGDMMVGVEGWAGGWEWEERGCGACVDGCGGGRGERCKGRPGAVLFGKCESTV